MPRWLLITAAVAIGLVALHFFLNWLTRDRPKRYQGRGSSGVGNALLQVHSLLEPGQRHALEERRHEEEDSEEDDSGEPPEAAAEAHSGAAHPLRES